MISLGSDMPLNFECGLGAWLLISLVLKDSFANALLSGKGICKPSTFGRNENGSCLSFPMPYPGKLTLVGEKRSDAAVARPARHLVDNGVRL